MKRAALRVIPILAFLALFGTPIATASTPDRAQVPVCPVGAEDVSSAFCRLVGEVGRFEMSRPGPVLAGAPTVEVLIGSAWGTSVREQTVALIADTGTGYRVLWRHVTLDMAPSLLPGDGPDVATVYRWRYAANGARIRVTGVRTVGEITSMRHGRARGESSALPAETYCYRGSTATFIPCA